MVVPSPNSARAKSNSLMRAPQTLPNLVEQIEMGVFNAFQIPYSALQSEHEEIISLAGAAEEFSDTAGKCDRIRVSRRLR
jgi:hypothetical protein